MPSDEQEEASARHASDIVAACESAWRSFQEQHPALPDAVIVLGSGVDRGRLVKLGHWWGARWEAGGQPRGEVLLAGEALHLPVEEVFEVLLHEAAHGINAARGIRDASRGGRYHNARFKSTAIEVGLVVEQLPPYGWAKTSLGPQAAERYAAEIEALRDSIRIARRIDKRTINPGTSKSGQEATGVGGRDGPDDGQSRGGGRAGSVALVCGCGRRMRMAPSVAAQGAVLCGACGSTFDAPDQAERRPDTGVVHLRPPGLTGPGNSGGGEPAVELFEQARRWALVHGAELDEPIVAESADQADLLNQFARTERRRLGYLTGPDLAAGLLLLAAGDQVVVGASPGHAVLPDEGVVGQVLAVSVGTGHVSIDFPVWGRVRIDAATAGRYLTYGYATTAAEASRPLPELPPSPADGSPGDRQPAEVIELGAELP